VLNVCLASSAQRIGAHKTSLGIALVPAVTTGFSALMLGEEVREVQWLAVAFLCGGSLLGVLSRNRSAA
jgi:drug/metabolite transporter (DMT)-like permease